MRPLIVTSALLAGLLLNAAHAGTVIEVKNDSLAGGGGGAVQLGFAIGEVGGAKLTPPAGSYTIQELQVYIDKSPLVPDTSMIGRFIVWDNANLPSGLGSPIYTSADLQMGAGFLNTQDVSFLNLTVNGPFTVGVEIVDSGQQFGLTSPTLVTDTNGCQNGKNWVRQTNGVWANLCAFGVSGDLVIRALVMEDAPTCGDVVDLGHKLAGNFSPNLAGSGCLDGTDDLVLDFTGMPPSTSAFLFIGLTQINASFKQGVLVPSPDLNVLLPTVFGSLSINLPYPVFPSGTNLYWQAWMPDAGAPAGACATQGIATVSP
ncbi:MAG: hypothetical protein H6825_06915 [Planctomycetes bacterium]|nr:hypothetical protein [Planctomycetota bacterium]